MIRNLNLQGIYLLILSSLSHIRKAITDLIGNVSPKQAIRPDPLLLSVRETIPSVTAALHTIAIKVYFTAAKFLCGSIEPPSYAIFKRLYDFEKGDRHNTADEKAKISDFLTTADRSVLLYLHDYLIFIRADEETLRFYKSLYDLISIDLPDLKDKMHAIEAHLNTNEDLPQDRRFTITDYRALFLSKGKMAFLSLLKENGIEAERLSSKWKELEAINQSETMKALRALAASDLKSGRVFFGHRYRIHQMRNEPFDLKHMIKNIAIGSMCHIGFMVENEGKTCFSHLGSFDKKHTAKPIHDPVFFTFSLLIELDITPLLPKTLTPAQTDFMAAYFKSSFESIARVERPHITMKENDHGFSSLWLGHKSRKPQELSDINLDGNQTIRCSIYASKVFLMAIKQVNDKLQELGLQEQIEHPFGKYEDLDRMDPLQVYTHFIRLNIAKPVKRALANIISNKIL